MNFTNLNIITSYSTLNSTIKINDLVETAKQFGYKSLAITDINVMHGVVQFYDECLAHDINPIIGMTLKTKGLNGLPISMVLLAKNETGYQNLLKISTMINTTLENHDISNFKEFCDGITAVIHPIENEVLNSNVNSVLDKYREIFSDLYLGYSPAVTTINTIQIYERLFESKEIKIIYLSEVRYLKAEDAIALKVLRAINQQEKIDPNDPFLSAPGSQELKTVDEITKSGKGDLFDAIKNANLLAETLKVKIVKEKTELPHFKPTVEESVIYLRELVEKGLQKLNKDKESNYKKRAKYELKIIEEMGFADYFLIIWDIINFANNEDIQLGAGRGSAAGSLVSFALGISKVDPIEHNLFFERFLNPERVNMPDIDLDVPDDKRNEIIKYLQKKYGRDNLAQIITFSTLGVKQALRDCLRVFSADNRTVSRWINAVPHVFHITLKQCYEQSVEFSKLVNADSFGRTMFSILTKIEGLPRQPSIHAAGVVISEDKLVKKIPLQNGGNDILITQYVYHDVEELGLLKIDILGLRNLSILKKMVDLIHKYDDPNFSIESVSMEDPDTIKVFHDADTDGVFQFESQGLKRVLLNMDVESFNDIVATNALFRPGPMGQIDTYIKHKKHQNEQYDPDLAPLKPIIDPTYGVIVYQEQVMQAANLMGGLPLSEADMLRRAMSKKNRKLLDQYQTKFIEGAVNNGYSSEQAKKVYDLIEFFSNYGFNKSHSVAYSTLAFWLAYIKAHFPLHFYTVQLGYSLGDYDRLRNFISAAKRNQIELISPNVNQSFFNFSDDGKKIIAGLVLIKGLRRDFINEVVAKRVKYGTFKDLSDLLGRVDQRYLREDNFFPLIRAGACDDLHSNRRELVENLKVNIDSFIFSQNNVSLFEQLKPVWDHYPDYSKDEKIEMEHELTGLYLDGTPFDEFEKLGKIYHNQKIQNLKNGKDSWVFATITKTQTIKDKTGKQMAFVMIDDAEDTIECIVFADQYFDLHQELIEGQKEALYGVLRKRKGTNFIISRMFSLKKANEAFENKKVFIDVSEIDNKTLRLLQQILRKNSGLSPVYLIDNKHKTNVLLNPNNWVTPDENFLRQLLNLMGSERVVYREREDQ